jgi:acyl-CoA oxidase
MRDLKTHEPLPGFEMGDIGPKIGYLSKDNGFMRMTNVKTPRDFLLKRFAEVDREGNFKVKGDLRTLYSVMLSTRVAIANYSSFTLG